MKKINALHFLTLIFLLGASITSYAASASAAAAAASSSVAAVKKYKHSPNPVFSKEEVYRAECEYLQQKKLKNHTNSLRLKITSQQQELEDFKAIQAALIEKVTSDERTAAEALQAHKDLARNYNNLLKLARSGEPIPDHYRLVDDEPYSPTNPGYSPTDPFAMSSISSRSPYCDSLLKVLKSLR